MRLTQQELASGQIGQWEWLETNGLGGYACGTVIGLRTRRYHGWLIAANRPPTDRVLLLAAADEAVTVNGQTVPLGAHLFRDGTIAPDGRLQLRAFVLDWCPQWHYSAKGVTVHKRVFMPHLRNATVLRYFVQTRCPTTLAVRLFVAWRDHHWTMQPSVPFRWQACDHRIVVAANGCVLLHLVHNGDAFVSDGTWWHNFWLPHETERGLDDTESLFCLGTLVKSFGSDGHLDLIAATEPCSTDSAVMWEASERRRRQRLMTVAANDLVRPLFRAADAFLALRSSTGTRTVIAGYPWFTDWGRDALIALPGLTLVPRRFAIARDVLDTFARYLDQGMVPNFFPEGGASPTYNTVDATLWFVLAVYRYGRYTRDTVTLRRWWAALRDVLAWHWQGTRYGIHADPQDGLLVWNAAGEALTWMDAKVHGVPVTPRAGKPVEINALWCNGLKVLARLAAQLGDKVTERQAERWAAKAIAHFAATFWNGEKRCLFDIIAPDGNPDSAVRCNQLLALALPFRLVTPEQERAVLRCVEAKLLTPCGLRSLAPDEPQYVGRYVGTPEQRDAAYHQGTVWAWWWGPYADAVAMVEGADAVQHKVRPLLAEFLQRHLREGCVGQIAEIFDGDAPHTPRGCFAQAWSVAEVLRAWCERVEGRLPPPLWDER